MASNMEAGRAGGTVYVPPAAGATVDEAVQKDDKKPVKDEAGKAKLDEIKSVVLNAMATKDPDNAILLQRIQQRFDRSAATLCLVCCKAAAAC
jgi:hypothetical protein